MDEGDAPLFYKSAQQSLAGRCLDEPGQMSEGERLAQTRRSPPSSVPQAVAATPPEEATVIAGATRTRTRPAMAYR